jgi:hypothetical protein
MSVNSTQQRLDQLKDWYKWFNHKYNRHDKIRFRKPKNVKE